MNLNDEIRNEITELAKIPGLSIADIADILGLKRDLFFAELKNPDSDVSQAYNKGKLLNKAELGKIIKRLSDQGSGPAQALMERMLRKIEVQNLLQEYENAENE